MRPLGLAAIGAPDEAILESLARGLPDAFGLPVLRLPAMAEPAEAEDLSRGQWSSADLLRALLVRARGETSRLLGVTPRDLFVPVLSFVFGQAQLGGTVAVVSLARLDPAFHGLPHDTRVASERALKEAVHELGHTFGLVHCADPGCAMSLSVDVRRLDAKRPRFCAGCGVLLRESPEMACEAGGPR